VALVFRLLFSCHCLPLVWFLLELQRMRCGFITTLMTISKSLSKSKIDSNDTSNDNNTNDRNNMNIDSSNINSSVDLVHVMRYSPDARQLILLLMYSAKVCASSMWSTVSTAIKPCESCVASAETVQKALWVGHSCLSSVRCLTLALHSSGTGSLHRLYRCALHLHRQEVECHGAIIS